MRPPLADARRVPRPFARRCALLSLLSILSLFGSAAGLAGPKKPPPPPPPPSASQLVQRGVLALAMRDFHAAYAALAEAYRLDPQPDTLYQLGVVRFAEGNTVAAHDLLRRYLREPGSEGAGAAAHRAEAERILSRPRPPSAELRVLAQPGDSILIDGRLVGLAPLRLPLLLTPGAHELSVIRGPAILRVTLQPRPGQVFEARTPAQGDALVVRRLAATWTVVEPAASAEAVAKAWAQLDPLMEQKGLARTEPAGSTPPACAGEHACLLAWAGPGGAEYVLLIRATLGSRRLSVELLDVAVAEPAAAEEADCDVADPAAVATVLSARLPTLLTRGVGRPAATVRITSTPTGAQVTDGERTLGFTPLTRSLFAGPRTLELRAPRHRPERRQIELQKDQDKALHVALEPEVVATSQQIWRRAPRPAARIAGGTGALLIGLALTGLGASALAVSGTCSAEALLPALECPRIYQTTGAGIGLLVPGVLMSAGGIALLAWPGPREAVDVWSPSRERVSSPRTSSRALIKVEF